MANKPIPLKNSSSFREATLKGKKRRLSAWLTLYVMSSPDSKAYFGVTTSRKVANAVIRNKLKRWVKNSARKEPWPEKYNNQTLVFVFKPQADGKFFSNIKYAEFLEVYRKI